MDEDKMEVDTDIQYKLVSHSIIINSLDRDWINTSDTPYNFRIKFSPEGQKRIKYPLYENNPTIPATETQSNSGNRGDANLSGWYDRGNTFRLAYDPSQSLGDEIDYEYITISESQYTPIGASYKNIVSMRLTNAIIPNHTKRLEYTTSTEYMSNYQYLNILIDELENTQEGTNTNLRKSFCMMYPKLINIDGTTINASKYMEFANINQWDVKINVNTMPIITFRCYDPSNKLISNVNDILNIDYVHYIDDTDPQLEKIVIKTSDYFDDKEFQSGHKIIIKNYKYIDANNIYGNSLNQFINREEGHYIIGTSVTDSAKYLKNLIYIPKPATLNTITGNIDSEAWYSLLKISDWEASTNTLDGKLINLNMQTAFFLQITTREHDNAILLN